MVAHEVGHMAVAYAEKTLGRLKSRNNGTGWGGDEEYICRIAKKFEDEISDDEVNEWIKEARGNFLTDYQKECRKVKDKDTLES